MICKDCADAADGVGKKAHCSDDKCTCQHRPIKEGQIKK